MPLLPSICRSSRSHSTLTLVPSLAPAPNPRRQPPPTILLSHVNSIPWHHLIGSSSWPRALNTNDVGTRLVTMLSTSIHLDRTPPGNHCGNIFENLHKTSASAWVKSRALLVCSRRYWWREDCRCCVHGSARLQHPCLNPADTIRC